MKKITNYKKAYEDLLKKYIELSREANRIAPTISALFAARNIEYHAMEELGKIRDTVIRHDV